ncbi:MAG: hypothetical protein K0R30_1404 [Ornithinibacter sp.]|jgi:hypothetical protein|nr:hypothetical protein [Ornithinibacter sp.]
MIMKAAAALRSLCALVLGLGSLALLPSSASATGSVTQLEIGNGQLLAKGAALTAPVTYTCEGGYGTLFLQVRQRVQGGGLVVGSGQWDTEFGAVVLPACSGSPQTVTVTIRPDTGSVSAFKAGVALAFLTFTACDDPSFTGCTFVQKEVEFRLGNR